MGTQGKLQTEGRPGLAGLTRVGSLAQKFRAIICRRAVVDRAVRAAGVVIVAEGPGDTLSFKYAGEQFAI